MLNYKKLAMFILERMIENIGKEETIKFLEESGYTEEILELDL